MEWVLSVRAEWLTPVMKIFTFLGDEEFFLLFQYSLLQDGLEALNLLENFGFIYLLLLLPFNLFLLILN